MEKDIKSFDELQDSTNIYDKSCRFPVEEYDIVGDIAEINKIINTSGKS